MPGSSTSAATGRRATVNWMFSFSISLAYIAIVSPPGR
jgi:hypothetical protein